MTDKNPIEITCVQLPKRIAAQDLVVIVIVIVIVIVVVIVVVIGFEYDYDYDNDNDNERKLLGLWYDVVALRSLDR